MLVGDIITISGATIDNSVIGGTTPAAATVTTITTNDSIVPDESDGATLGTSSAEFSDIFLADGAVINLGDEQDVTLTHVEDTGIAHGAQIPTELLNGFAHAVRRRRRRRRGRRQR